jgi:site-specific DNA recombinase
MPHLFELATAQEKLAIVKSLLDRIWVENRRIVRLTTRMDVGPILTALVKVLNGVPDGFLSLHIKPTAPYQLFLTPKRHAA